MPNLIELSHEERQKLEQTLTDALTLRDELAEGVDAGLLDELLLQAHDNTIAKARAVLNFTTTA
jgi:hypothetical protein